MALPARMFSSVDLPPHEHNRATTVFGFSITEIYLNMAQHTFVSGKLFIFTTSLGCVCIGMAVLLCCIFTTLVMSFMCLLISLLGVIAINNEI